MKTIIYVILVCFVRILSLLCAAAGVQPTAKWFPAIFVHIVRYIRLVLVHKLVNESNPIITSLYAHGLELIVDGRVVSRSYAAYSGKSV